MTPSLPRSHRFPLLDAALDAIVVMDSGGRIVELNASAEATFGLRRDEARGELLADLIIPERFRAAHTQGLARYLAGGAAQLLGKRVEMSALRRDGSELRVELAITSMLVDGTPLFVGYLRDLTEQLLAEARHERDRLELAAAAARLVRLQDSTAKLALADTVVDVAEALLAAGTGALGAETAAVIAPRDETTLEILASVGISTLVSARHRIMPRSIDAPLATVFHSGEPVWIEDEESFRQRYPLAAAAIPSAASAAAALPIHARGEVAAVVAYRFGHGRRFSDADRALLQTFATQAGHALERVLAHQQEVAARRRLEALADLTSSLATMFSEAEVARTAIERGMLAVAADTCMLYRVEPDGALALVAERGCPPLLVERLARIEAHSTNPTMETIRANRTLWVESEAEYLALFPGIAGAEVTGPRVKAFWSVPLFVEGQAIGLLAMGFYAPRRFLPDERVFVEIFARNAAQALRRGQRLASESRARRSLEITLRSIGDAVIASDTTGAVTFLNPMAEQLTGWTQADALGHPASEIFHIINESTRLPVESPIERALREGKIVGLANHTLLIARNGDAVPISDSAAPLRDESGDVVGVVLVFRDVTAKRREELRRTFLEDATVALVDSLDYETTLGKVAQLVVPRLADWCAVDIVVAGTAKPKRLAVAHVDPEKRQLAKELDAKYPPPADAPTGVPHVLRSGRSELYAEIPVELILAGCVDEEHRRIALGLKLRSAMVVPLVARERVLGVMTFVYAESGRHYNQDDLRFAEDVARRCAIAIDNAQLYASEQVARQSADVANRAKDEFLAIVSHELRTPLNAIMGWSKLMSSPRMDEAGRVRAVDTIQRNAVAMAQLIEDLLDISRIVSGKMRLEVQQLKLARVIDAALEAVKPAADAKGIRIVAEFEPTLPRLVGDPARLQQVAWNLLSNAVKFTPRDGRIEVVVRERGSWAELSVADNGKGIAPQFLPFVFDSFRQEDGSHTRSKGGLGLGLAITRQLVELHGGRIEAASDGDSRGARFTVRLPISAVALSAPPLSSGARQPASNHPAFDRPAQLRGLHVLVVDDQEDARRLIKAILDDCGCRVTLAAGVDEAMGALTHDVPDILISDIGMPEADGYELIRRVRALAPDQGGDMPAAALSAYARAEDRSQILNAGFSMHIPKPVEPGELVAAVASLTRFLPRRRVHTDPGLDPSR